MTLKSDQRRKLAAKDRVRRSMIRTTKERDPGRRGNLAVRDFGGLGAVSAGTARPVFAAATIRAR
jgi:hypothetical protein